MPSRCSRPNLNIGDNVCIKNPNSIFYGKIGIVIYTRTINVDRHTEQCCDKLHQIVHIRFNIDEGIYMEWYLDRDLIVMKLSSNKMGDACSRCNGTGTINGKRCSKCGGTGR